MVCLWEGIWVYNGQSKMTPFLVFSKLFLKFKPCEYINYSDFLMWNYTVQEINNIVGKTRKSFKLFPVVIKEKDTKFGGSQG